jgi:hypothetical protein
VVFQGTSGARMIVEFPSVNDCARLSHAPGLMAEAHRAFIALVPSRPERRFQWLQPGLPVTIEGLLFFDKVHGQTGVAPNGAEIHPVLRVKARKGSCGPGS